MAEELPVFTDEELKQYTGQNGKPVYIVYDGRVFDVSESKMWKTGRHMKQHDAGEDLTDQLPKAPHGEEVFERFPQVGTYKAPEPEPTPAEEEFDHLPGFLARLIGQIPFLEKHPHPMTVHFPLVFMYAAPVFALLYLFTGVEGFEVTTFYLLGAAAFFALVGISTGFLTWWVNYRARPVKAVTIKIAVSTLALVDAAVAFFWRLTDPTVLTNLQGVNVLYLVLVLLLIPLITVVGTYGALLTFPIPEKIPTRKQLERKRQESETK